MKRSGRSVSYPDKLADGLIASRHIGDLQVTSAKLADGAVTRAKVPATFIQSGRATVSLPFSAVGVETVSATIAFPTAFPSVPAVAVEVEGVDVSVVRVEVSNTGFTVYVRDDAGVDYSTGQTATVSWVAVAG